MRDAYVLEENVKFNVLATPIRLNMFNFMVKKSFNMGLKLQEDIEDITLTFNEIQPCKTTSLSKHQEVAAAEEKFAADSKVKEANLKELRERLDARGKELTQREADLTRHEGEIRQREEQARSLRRTRPPVRRL